MPTTYAPAETKPFTFADRCEESFLVAKFDGIDTSIRITAVDQNQVVSLLKRLITRLERGKAVA